MIGDLYPLAYEANQLRIQAANKPYTRHLKTGARVSARECNEHRYDRMDEKTAVRDVMPRSGLLFRIALHLG